jgi:heme oxygenase
MPGARRSSSWQERTRDLAHLDAEQCGVESCDFTCSRSHWNGMHVVHRVSAETAAFQAAIDDEPLFGSTSAVDYRAYLMRMFGFVYPVERSILSTPKIGHYVDVRRFQKHELLRRDLASLRMSPEPVGGVPLCSVPLFDAPEEALGWAYLIERSALRHGELFRHLASAIPGEVAFASSYLKCYFGVAGEMWRGFADRLEVFERSPREVERLLESAKAAFRCYRTWRFMHEQPESITPLAAPMAAG